LGGVVTVLVVPGWVTVRAGEVVVAVTVTFRVAEAFEPGELAAMSALVLTLLPCVAALAGGVGPLITLSTWDT
ncbi:MAG: hypothetical protein ACTHNU_00055, partial [Gaiellales bacterium]